MKKSKNEINRIVETYKLFEDFSVTGDERMRDVIRHINDYIPFEKPDAFFKADKTIYGIEHFQVSLYMKRRSGDISKIAEGSRCNRDRMENDKEYDFQPSIDNLLSALRDNLHSHAKSFESYKNNLLINEKNKDSKYALIIFVEDSSESGYIVRKRETEAVNPLLLKQVAEIFLEYKDDIYGVIFTTGNERQKRITGCTLDELKDKLDKNELLDAKGYAPFEESRKVYVSKTDSDQDRNCVTIHLFDRL